MGNTLTSRGMLVAETDENGRVVHVWIKDTDDRFPHPCLGNCRDISAGLERYSIVGAGREDVTRWLSTRH